MIHPHTKVQFINEKIGYGLVATKLIPKGTIVWCLDNFDQVFTPEQVAEMAAPYRAIMDVYSFRNEKGEYVLCWDNTKFVNHSSNSNCLTTAYQYELAIRDIQPGEQIFNDYGYLNLPYVLQAEEEEGVEGVEVRADDMLKRYPEWDQKLKDAYACLNQVEQPLKTILAPELWAQALDIAEGKREMDSILLSYFMSIEEKE
jgi:hypothetical protein